MRFGSEQRGHSDPNSHPPACALGGDPGLTAGDCGGCGGKAPGDPLPNGVGIAPPGGVGVAPPPCGGVGVAPPPNGVGGAPPPQWACPHRRLSCGPGAAALPAAVLPVPAAARPGGAGQTARCLAVPPWMEKYRPCEI